MTGKSILTGILSLCSLSVVHSQDIKLEDIWLNGKYRSDYVYGLRSMNDGKNYTSLAYTKKGTAILKKSYANASKIDTLVATSWLPEKLVFQDYAFSNDEKKLLLKTEIEPIYRHSTKEYNYVYDLDSKSLTRLDADLKQRYATFSPQGDKIAYVEGNNILVHYAGIDKRQPVTSDGEFNRIINGATDWVYEEEFAIDKAFFWSPTGRYIAFLRFDETEVPEFNMALYGGSLYPRDYKFKYPKAGEVNSKVTLLVYDLENRELREVAQTKNSIEYLPRVKWVDNHKVAYQALNRHQNRLDINIYDFETSSNRAVYSEDDGAYVEVIDGWELVGEELFITSEASGFNHIYAVNINTGNNRAITTGNFDVTDFYGTDGSKYVYYQSAEESPLKRAIYKIDFDGESKTKLSKEDGWNDAEFSTGMKYFVNSYSNANSPGNYTLYNSKGAKVRVLKNNESLNAALKETKTNKKEFITIPSQGYELNAWMIKPSNFDSKKQYPVLIAIYGGPGSQQVTDQWGGANYMWHQLLAEKGYIVVSVDNRGTGARGSEFKKLTYQNLGALELEDYISTSKFLGDLQYIDKERIGIWGWSYGGYMSSLAATKGSEHFKAAIAVAPVTTWRFYDNIYTERYNGIPQENPKGYDENSPINFANQLNSNYLLIHGTADDNVHYQNAVEMVNALIKAGKQFDSFYYPDRNHGIYGGNTRLHIYQLMTDWLEENL